MQPIPHVLVGLTAMQRRWYNPLEVLMAGAIRIFMAALIALSVAALPVSGSFAAGNTVSAMEHSDCDKAIGDPCDQIMPDCAAMGLCALKCFTFVGFEQPVLISRDWRSASSQPLVIKQMVSRLVETPFHPPRQ